MGCPPCHARAWCQPAEPDRRWLQQGLRFLPRAGNPINQENNRPPTRVNHGGRRTQIKRLWHPSLALLVLPVGVGLRRLAPPPARSPVGSTSTRLTLSPNHQQTQLPAVLHPFSSKLLPWGGQPLGRDRDECNESRAQIPTVCKVLGVKYVWI